MSEAESLFLEELNGIAVGYAECYSRGPGFESQVSHGSFQKVKHSIVNLVL
jgi:hypothetical protein